MDDYVERMINEFSIKISKMNTALTPDGNNIFEKGNIKRLGKKETEEFHASVSTGMFVAKRVRPDIHQLVTGSTRVKEPNDLFQPKTSTFSTRALI